MKKTKKNFTLVELLCAVALVVILAGIGFSAYSYASHRGKEAATRSLITRLEAGLETLKTKHGFYPSSASSSYSNIGVSINSTTGLVEQISFGGRDIPQNTSSPTAAEKKQLKDFLSVVDGENLKKYVSNGNLTDAWGSRIQYKYPGAVNTAKYDIIAPGADEHFGKAGTSTSPCASLADYKDNDEWACDDIANFDKL